MLKLWPNGEDDDQDSNVRSDEQNIVLDLIETVPNHPFRDIPPPPSPEEVIEGIEIDGSVPVMKEISNTLIIQNVLNPQKARFWR